MLFRGADGTPAALEDRCCHRAAPLSLGAVEGDHLRCGYHGLTFDTKGQCVSVPGQDTCRRARGCAPIRSPSDMAWSGSGWAIRRAPTTSKIVELPWLAEQGLDADAGLSAHRRERAAPDRQSARLYPRRASDKNTISGDPREATTPTKTERLNDGVRVGRWMIDFKPPPLFAKAGGFDGNVDRWQHATWRPPSIVYMDVGAAKTGTGAPEGDRSQGISIWSTHLVTPESETTCHYHFGFARNFQRDDAAMSKLLYDGTVNTFLEDKVMLEAQQKNLKGGAIDGLIHITADAAQMQARRMLDELVRAEAR